MPFDRRDFLRLLASVAVVESGAALAQGTQPIKRAIPSTGELLPVIGLGTWITFNVAPRDLPRTRLKEVLQVFFREGGALIDSSPMYGYAEEAVGELLKQVPHERLFAATKVWTLGRWLGVRQMERSQALWGVARFDLMEVHNLLDWKTHLETLKAWKAEGRVRYIGVTTSHGRRLGLMERVMMSEPLDFVQFTYNIADREAERRLLPLAAERRIAVIANRPFQTGALFDLVRNRPLPDFAAEFDCRSWAQFFLKFIVSHPAVTCAIPATSNPAHMADNMGAGFGRLPDAAMRQRMAEYFGRI
jgi:diketogulonate reductase-like aldo/keto reductase